MIALMQRAAAHGRSAEAKDRESLKAALQRPARHILSSMPNVGTDADYARAQLVLFLIYTNIISKARKGLKANRGVVEFFTTNANEGRMYLAVQTIGEPRQGDDGTE